MAFVNLGKDKSGSLAAELNLFHTRIDWKMGDFLKNVVLWDGIIIVWFLCEWPNLKFTVNSGIELSLIERYAKIA